jgi:hypothetical protein
MPPLRFTSPPLAVAVAALFGPPTLHMIPQYVFVKVWLNPLATKQQYIDVPVVHMV